MKTEARPHPAKFNEKVLTVCYDELVKWLGPQYLHAAVLDPFAGVGGIHKLQPDFTTLAIEIEAEWARQAWEHGWTWCGDFFDFNWSDRFSREDERLELQVDDGIDAVVTSTTYGNRMADHHEARDASERNTYRHKLGRELTPGNSGALQWGEEYKVFHLMAWRRVWKLLPHKGLFILNVKNHVRKGHVQKVAEWHYDQIRKMGFACHADHKIPVRGLRQGENHELRVPHEHVFVFQKGVKQ